jgi:Rieske Fe-S protein
MGDEKEGENRRIDRRQFVVWAVGSVVGARHALRAPSAWASESGEDTGPAVSDRLVAVSDPQSKTPLRVADIAVDATPVMALPFDSSSGTVRDGTRLNRILLLRIDPKDMEPAARERAADGVLAFSAVCTHEACFVSGWLPGEACLVCPCHSSKFNARSEGEVLSGPASRALPSLPLKLVGDELAIAGSFSSMPGVKRKSE